MMTMRQHSIFISIIALCAGGPVQGGEAVVPRRQFKETVTYPFVFKPEGYLANKGPLPMRFGSAAPQCQSRNPPALPAVPLKELPPELPAPVSKGSADPIPFPEEVPVAPPVEPEPKREKVDFEKVPDEVLEFFKNTEGRPVRRAYLFDPIFQPVLPDDLPKSKAQSVQE